MGAIWFRRAEFLGAIGEIVGHKAGLVLGIEDLRNHAPEFEEYWTGDEDARLRIRSEEVEEVVHHLLYAVGNIPTPEVGSPPITLYHRHKAEPEGMARVKEVLALFHETVKAEGDGPVDLNPFLYALEGRHPTIIGIGLELIDLLELSVHANPWSQMRRIPWKDVTELRDLFESESLTTSAGAFFDQRYLDYLAQNFETIDDINWRKFEGLSAEFFQRAGYEVQLGPGRDDGNVDLRVWRADRVEGAPPLILVQSKRQRAKVPKVVVKALWADVQAEHAESGLIVTTSSLSPGAERVATARAYPIRQANREALRSWIEAMRSPQVGIFMAE